MSTTAISCETSQRVRDRCLCLHVSQATRALGRRFDQAFRPVGLTSGQFSLLNAINGPSSPPTIGEVAATLAMDRTTLTANLKPLVRRGLLEIIPDPDDRRGRRIRLTAEGMAALADGLPIWESLHATIEEELPYDADQLRQTLRALL
jgi:DNA-binding MarR family transcriptional regulator